jgi:hypothetical protein
MMVMNSVASNGSGKDDGMMLLASSIVGISVIVKMG